MEEVKKKLVGNPQNGKETFLEKLKIQFKGVQESATRLVAEMLCIYYLFPEKRIGVARKLENVKAVLDWSRPSGSLPLPAEVSQAFAYGIGDGGQSYNTRQPDELEFLICFSIAWKGLSHEERKKKANDAWEFKKFIDTVPEQPNAMLRNILPHLLFPDDFEPIASSSKKRDVVRTFSEFVTVKSNDDDQKLAEKSNDDDQKLAEIRLKLENLVLYPNEKFESLQPPFVDAWGGRDRNQLEMIQHKKQIVLYGPPGTGKTFTAKKLAKDVIRAAALKTLGVRRFFEARAEIESAFKTNVHRLQLHPAYSYEDFVRALHIAEGGATEYRDGYLPRLIRTIEGQRKKAGEGPQEGQLPVFPHVLILDEMNRTDLSRMFGECFSLLEDRNEPIDLPGYREGSTMQLAIPDDLYVIGTMNLIDQSIEQIDFALRRRFLWRLCPFSAKDFLDAAEQKWGKLKLGLNWDLVKRDFERLAGAAQALNKQIYESPLLGSQYEIGHTYLLDTVEFLFNFLGDRPTRKKNYLWNDNKNDNKQALEPVTKVWDYSLQPLLEQYLAGVDAAKRKSELEKLKNTFQTPVEVQPE